MLDKSNRMKTLEDCLELVKEYEKNVRDTKNEYRKSLFSPWVKDDLNDRKKKLRNARQELQLARKALENLKQKEK